MGKLIKKINELYDDISQTKYFVVNISYDKNYIPRVYAPNKNHRGTCSALHISKQNNFEICINAGLFNPHPDTYEPEGVIIENGKVIQNLPANFYPDSMPLTIDKNGILGFANANVNAYDLIKNGIISSVCGFMPIIIDFKEVPKMNWTNVPHYDGRHQRQIIGQFDNNDYAIITCEGRGYANSDGWTIFDAQRICIGLNLKFAYNLDGGTSTELIVNGEQLNSTYEKLKGRFASTFIVI